MDRVRAIENDEVTLRVEVAIAVVHIDQAVGCCCRGGQGRCLNGRSEKCENANRGRCRVRDRKSSREQLYARGRGRVRRDEAGIAMLTGCRASDFERDG